MHHVRLLRCLASLLLLAGVAAPMLAQSQATTGVIEGTVVGPDAAAVAGATVTLTNTGTNFERVAVTDGRGRFRAVALPLGPYRVTVALEGFASAVHDGLQLSLGQTLTLSFSLELATVEQEIVVTTAAPLIETSRPESSIAITRETLEEVPNNGRNFLEFMKLTPGVAIVQGPDGDEISVNGQKGIQNNVSVDGADFNNPFFGEQRGGQRPAFTFNLDAVQEFVVVADGAPAEFGRSSSGFVNVVTKSGANDSSGTAHLFFKNDTLAEQAQRADGSREPEFDSDQLQTGFTYGGPVQRDKTFFFVALDYQDAQTTKQNDPDRIERRVVDAFAALGAPNENGPISHSDDNLAALVKIDWHLGSSNLFTLRGTYTDTEQNNGTFDVDSWGVSANANELDESKAISGTLLSTVGSSTLNELRFQWAQEDRPRPYLGPNIAGTDRPFPDTAFDFDRGYRFGMPFFIPVIYDDTRYQLNDNVSWLRGDHTFKAGIEYNRTEAFQTFIGFANGRFIFGSTDGFLNYVDDPTYVECSDGSTGTNYTCPAGTEITGPVLLYLQQAGAGGRTVEQAGTQTITQEEPAVFFQDTWQPTANLTFQFGLRWEAQLQPDLITPKDQLFYAPFIGQTVNGQEFPGDGTIPSDNSMWQPRLGVSWDPKGDGNTVVRANAGIYYARIPGLNLASSRSTDGTRGQTLFRNSALIPILGPPPPYTELIPQSSVGDPFLPDVFVFDKDFQNPRTTSAAIAVEQAFAGDYVALFKINYAKTDHLTRFVNRNDPLLGSPWGSGLAPAGVNGINTLTTVESTARSRYLGYTLGLTKRMSDGFSFNAYYTNSKDKSDDDNERDPFSFRYARITDLDAEWSYSDRDQRHRINAWGIWQAPGGVQVTARYGYRSPQPKSITATGADAATPQDRINPDGSVTRRNLGRKDNRFSSVDLRISRPFQAGSLEIEPILEVFNLFDGRNPQRPEVTNLIFNFDGTVQSGLGDPRQIQLGLRVAW